MAVARSTEGSLSEWPLLLSYHEGCPQLSRGRVQAGDFIVFGKETKGLPAEVIAANPDTAITIPMPANTVRSLNLSTSAGIVLYEALRQTGRIA